MDAPHPTPLHGIAAVPSLTDVIVAIALDSAPRPRVRVEVVICPRCEEPVRRRLEAVSMCGDAEQVLYTYGPDGWCLECWWDHGPDGWEQHREVAA